MNITISTKTGPETIESPGVFSSVLLIFATRSQDSPAQLTFHYKQSTQLVHFINSKAPTIISSKHKRRQKVAII